MKKFLSLTAGLLSVMAVQAADTLFIKAPQVPILIERNDNVLFYMRMDAKETKTLDEVTVTFGKDVPLSQVLQNIVPTFFHFRWLYSFPFVL